MLVKDIEKIEAEFFADRRASAIPELLCAYYEQGDYALACFIAQSYASEFVSAQFYWMMSLVEMGYKEEAFKVHGTHKGDWFNLFRQYHIYWKHAVRYALFFKDFDISEYYQCILDGYFEEPLVQLLEMAQTERAEQLMQTDLYRAVEKQYPVMGEMWRSHVSRSGAEVLTFEKLQWNIWKKQNEKIENGRKYAIEQIYSDSDVKIYSYKPKVVAASMHILTDKDNTIMLDCGCERSGTDVTRIPVKEIFEYLNLDGADAIFISHAHKDHYGSLNETRKYQVYMTDTTKQLIRLSAPEVALDHVQTLNEYACIDVNGIQVTFVPNGHIRGSVMMNINWKNKKRIVYTGDYSVEDQCCVPGFRVADLKAVEERNIDILITETTFGNKKGMLKLADYEKIFVAYCQKLLLYKNKIIIPCLAVGRVQEVAMLLANLAGEMGAKILIDGSAADITQYYQLEMEDNILSKNISTSSSDFELSEKIMNNDIILASSGMMREGSLCARYIQELIEQENVCVMKVGFIQKDEHLLMSVMNRKDKNLHFVEIPLSAHAGYQSLVETTEALAPDRVLYVHGGGIEK